MWVASPGPATCYGRGMTTDYPEHLEHRILWQGQPVLIRPVRADDATRYIDQFHTVSDDDLRFRFLRTMRQLPNALIRHLTEIDYERHMAFVAEGLKGDLMAITRLVQDGCRKSAEFAIIVRTDLQRQGLGTLMQNRLLDYATSLGLNEVWGLIDGENRKALSLFDKLGFSRGFSFDSPFARVVKVLAPYNPITSAT